MRKVTKKSKRRLLIFGIISVIAIGYFFVTLVSYSYSYISLKSEEINLNNELISLQEKKEFLKNEIVKLNDPEYVIRYAKENYLYSEDGEYVLMLEDDAVNEVNQNNSNNIYYIIGTIVFLIIILILSRKKEKSK
ncbi:MAG TPA: septum formation initiator family protein [Candidatus Faecisoma merdavium]|nr:septum formation initiator family protein [Candidatus Faecisoma merdavium]